MFAKIALMLMIILLFINCSNRANIADEKENIKKAVINRHETFTNVDYEAFIAFWLQEPYTAKDWTDRGITVGWDSLDVFFKGWFDRMGEQPEKYGIERFDLSEFDITIQKKIAYVFYTARGIGLHEGVRDSSEMRVLNFMEKRDGSWKIVFETYPEIP